MGNYPTSYRISFQGKVEREDPHLVPHNLAFPSAMTSLHLFMGGTHRTEVLEAHNRTWREDRDYNFFTGVSGEAFRHLHQTGDCFRLKLPEGGRAVEDCFVSLGIPVSIVSRYDGQPATAGAFRDDEELRGLVMNNLCQGYPVLLLGHSGTNWVLLATGWEENGRTLVAWTFAPGADMSNKSFSPEDCQYIRDWAKGVEAAALVQGEASTEASVGISNRIHAVESALARGHANLLRGADALYGGWLNKLADASLYASPLRGRPAIDPDIWDLAERRAFGSGFLEEAAGLLSREELRTAAADFRAIHDKMWEIHQLCDEENGAAVPQDQSVREQIAAVVRECRRLDLQAASVIAAVLTAKGGVQDGI